jgi:hypothetical protein
VRRRIYMPRQRMLDEGDTSDKDVDATDLCVRVRARVLCARILCA